MTYKNGRIMFGIDDTEKSIPVEVDNTGKIKVVVSEFSTPISKAVIYGKTDTGVDTPLLVNSNGALYNMNLQEGTKIADGVLVFPALAAQDTVKFVEIPSINVDLHKSYMLYFLNPTPTAFTVSLRNKWFATPTAEIGAALSTITLPGSPLTLFSGTAWSSCFTSIGGVLKDESADLNDPGASDVPDAFGAIDDAIYFGNSSQFRTIVLAVGTAGVYNASGQWEYWNGSAWSRLTVTAQSIPGQDATPFKVAGGVTIGFGIVNDWVPYDIPGLPESEYWIRWRVTSFTSNTTAFSLTQGYFSSYKDPISSCTIVDGLFNSDGIQLFMSNNAALTLPSDIPMYYQIRSV